MSKVINFPLSTYTHLHVREKWKAKQLFEAINLMLLFFHGHIRLWRHVIIFRDDRNVFPWGDIVFETRLLFKMNQTKVLSVFHWWKVEKNILSFLPAFYPIMCLMKSSKKFEKTNILNVWKLVSFWVDKTHFRELLTSENMHFQEWFFFYFHQYCAYNSFWPTLLWPNYSIVPIKRTILLHAVSNYKKRCSEVSAGVS